MNKWTRIPIFGNTRPLQKNECICRDGCIGQRSWFRENLVRQGLQGLCYCHAKNAIALNRQKTWKKTSNEQMQIGVTHPFLQQKKASTKSSNTTKKNYDNTAKWISETSWMSLQSVAHRNEQNKANENCEKRGSGTEANVQTSKHAKVKNWIKKIRQAVHKSTAKNKATRTELRMQW